MSEQDLYSLKIDIFDREGLCKFTVGEWNEFVLPICYIDEVFNNSGWIYFDAMAGKFDIKCDHPYVGELADKSRQRSFFSLILSAFINNYSFGWSPPLDKMISYDENYHKENNYLQGSEDEKHIKEVQAKIIQRLAVPKKLLVAGCSNGELVRQCRGLGLDAWGFDVVPNLLSLALPDVIPYLRVGSINHIPFGRSECFDTLVAIDVLEHIPERDLGMVLAEFHRLGFQKMVLLINLNEWRFPGHITLRPIEWWIKVFEKFYRHIKTVRSYPDLPHLYSNDGLYNHQWLYFEAL